MHLGTVFVILKNLFVYIFGVFWTFKDQKRRDMEKRSYGEEKRVTGHLNLADPIIWLAPEITRQYVANWTKRGLDAGTQTDG